ncbi:SH3 domain-containing protein [Candidatus Pelagibacter sp.]|uniref:SH3 domain-containing protein n=1 Tax=Candidatus Pelagibacter sp. TaxID=2024849 RepID=UPI003F83E23E
MIKKFLILLTIILIYPVNVFSEDIFLSLKKNKVNVRYGPGFNFQVKYVYNKINLPIKQIDQKENFRRIIDLKNNSGWIHVSQLKKSNSIISLDDKILFTKPTVFSKPLAKIKKGRLLVIKKCSNNWCKITSNEFNGWIEAKNIWGSIN